MSTRRLQRMARRRRQVFIQKFLIFIITFIIASFLSISLGSNFAEAQDEESSSHVRQTYYRSIEIASGDTLWDIAAEYMDESYDSINDYIRELMNINGLSSDQIQEGQYLTVVYYH